MTPRWGTTILFSSSQQRPLSPCRTFEVLLSWHGALPWPSTSLVHCSQTTEKQGHGQVCLPRLQRSQDIVKNNCRKLDCALKTHFYCSNPWLCKIKVNIIELVTRPDQGLQRRCQSPCSSQISWPNFDPFHSQPCLCGPFSCRPFRIVVGLHWQKDLCWPGPNKRWPPRTLCRKSLT